MHIIMTAYVTWIHRRREGPCPLQGDGEHFHDIVINRPIKANRLGESPLRTPILREESSHWPSHTGRVSLCWKPLEGLLKQPPVQSDTLHSSSEPGGPTRLRERAITAAVLVQSRVLCPRSWLSAPGLEGSFHKNNSFSRVVGSGVNMNFK